LGAVGGKPATAQDDLPIAAFYGTFAGSGVAKSEDSLFYGVTLRDLDVTIAPRNGGFAVTWTTLLREPAEGGSAPPRRKTGTRIFEKTSKPWLYRAAGAGNLLEGAEIGWARIEGNSLFVYLMRLDEKGRYDIQTYRRTLAGTGMDLTFTRMRDGDNVRSVSGKLVKDAN
ncbi:MAG: hypothetical protein K8F57_02540, partial [Alphaproteobacteria bacterium]|nr:hypothetical protein [Alphaproteobacteria bacterium]